MPVAVDRGQRVVRISDHPAYERHDDPERTGRMMAALRRLRHNEIEALEEWLRDRGAM